MFYEFDAVLQKSEGKIPLTIFYVPFSVQDAFGANGQIDVSVLIDNRHFSGVLLPSRRGHYMVFTKLVLTYIPKSVGDAIHVRLEQAALPEALVIPELLLKKLKYDTFVLERFNALPKYIKKAEIDKIKSAKNSELQLTRIDALIIKLKRSS